MVWAHVQGGVQDNVSGTTNALVLAATVGSGNLVCGIIGWSSGTLTDLTSITDDKGNTYNIVAKVSDDSNWAQAGYWLANITNAPKTITAHFAISVGSIQIGDEFSGGGASATIDKSNTNLQVNPGTGVGAITSGSVTPAVNGELIYGGAASTMSSTPVYSADTAAGFTQLERDGTTNPVTEFLVQATAAAIATLFTDNTATDRSLATIMTFSPTTGGTIFNVSLIEAASATDTDTVIANFNSSIIESATATDIDSVIAAYNASIIESATAIDIDAATAIMHVSLIESGSATDSVSGGILFTVSISEAANATDVDSSVVAFNVTITEINTATDFQSISFVFDVSVNEAGNAIDTLLSSATFNVICNESVNAQDVCSQIKIYPRKIRWYPFSLNIYGKDNGGKDY